MEIPSRNSTICDLLVENILKINHEYLISIAVEMASGYTCSVTASEEFTLLLNVLSKANLAFRPRNGEQ